MIVWIQNGSFLHIVNTNPYQMQNALYCIAPGQMHQLVNLQNTRGYIIYFTADCIAGKSAVDLLIDIPIFYKEPCNLLNGTSEETKFELADVFQRLFKEYDNFSLLRFDILCSYLKLLVAHLHYNSTIDHSRQPIIQGSDLTKKFFLLLEKKYKIKKQVSDYASELAITPSYLNELIKKVTGMSAGYHIKNRIITEAKRQAIQNGLNMKETAYLLGFDDMAHFSKYFKNATGFNFTNFKKNRNVVTC
jgi:AraC-like DNA-binding protein